MSVRRAGGSPGVTVVGLASRAAGLLVWRLSRSETLPVAPLAESPAPPAPTSSAGAWLVRVVGLLAILVGAGALAVGLSARHGVRAMEDQLIVNPSGISLDGLADLLGTGLTNEWWVRFYPGFGSRVDRIAAALRTGRIALVHAADSYIGFVAALRGLSVPARMLDGAALARPVRQAIDEVRTPFLRQSGSYQEMLDGISPYLALAETGSAALRATVEEIPPADFLLLSLTDASGKEIPTNLAPLRNGQNFTLPLRRATTLRLTLAARSTSGRTLQTIDGLELPIEEWDDAPIRLPRTGTPIRFRFDPSDASAVPEPRMLSVAALGELAPYTPRVGGAGLPPRREGVSSR